MDGQIDDLLEEIRVRSEKNERVLVTTLTKKMAEDLTAYLRANGVRVRYMHSDVQTIERMEIIRDLRLGEFDVLVGINLLREGLDLPDLVMACIVMYDATGVRREAGEHAKLLNQLLFSDPEKMTPSQKALKEFLGHTPLEVLGGAVLGIVLGMLMPV